MRVCSQFDILRSMPSDLLPKVPATSSGALDAPSTSVQPKSMKQPLATTLRSRLAAAQRWVNTHRWQTVGLSFGVLLVLLISVAGVLAYTTYQIALTMQAQAKEAETIGRTAYQHFKEQNLPAAKTSVLELQDKVKELEQTYARLALYQFLPIAHNYYADGQHGLSAATAALSAGERALTAIEPYADVLGFSGEGAFEGGTAEDRLKLILQTVDKILPEIDAIALDLQKAETELALINPARFPEQLRGIAVRSYVEQAQEVSAGAVSAVTEFRPVLEQLPEVAGASGERKQYLILFQNDNELRATGGFLTAYAIINVEDGKVTPETSDDIYELDKKFTKRLPIPEQLGKYLTTERYWNLRDMNISPDFKTSMDTFYEHYSGIRGAATEIDGIIAIDTEFLTGLLRVLGPVEVPGYGTFSAENSPKCDCPQIIYALSEIITRPTPYLRDDRKGILGPMMRAILTKAYGAPKQQWPDLFAHTQAAITGRHVQLYFMDEKSQLAAEAINAAGRMQAKPQEDFLGIVNANLGGAKSNLFVEHSVKQTVAAPENGMLKKTVEITYRNTRKADNCNLEAGLLCLNSTLRDWTRLYIPAGSQLVEAQGFTTEPKTYDEDGFTVIDGFFILEPLGSATLKITYTVPYADETTYTARVWKQGGIETFDMLMDVTGGQEQLVVAADTVYTTKF
jgi:hypothetical protein